MVELEASKPFRKLGSAECEALRRIAQERNYAARQEIFKEGDCGDGLYVLKAGAVEIGVDVEPSGRRVLATVSPGEIFGEMAVLEYKTRSASATAAEDCVAYFIPRTELLAMIERHPRLALELMREISERLRDFNHRYIEEVLQTERLAVVGRFARSIVHDIKNPLNIISLTAELSGMDQATPQMRQKASRTIRSQVERVSEMVGEILDFTQGTSSTTVFASMDYGAFVSALVDEIRPEMEIKGSRIELQAVDSVRVPMDPKRLKRVFSNLIHNATDAMPEGGTIRLRFLIRPGEVVTEVEDTGPGIAAEMEGKLFQVFATHGKMHGTGLGLSICKKIVEDHGGRIWTRVEPGHGAIFCFSLPQSPISA